MIPHRSERPSVKELDSQLRKAKGLIALRWAPANPDKLLSDFRRLGLHLAQEQSGAIVTALSEIKPAHSAGRRPPEKAYEKTIFGRELFAFCWASSLFQRTLYLKFRTTKDTLFIVSFHESKIGD